MDENGDELAFDLIDRLHKSLRVSGHDAQSLARALGVHPNTINNYLSGRTRPSRPDLIAWSLVVDHGITVDWLEHGGGVVPNPPSGRQEERDPDPVEEWAKRRGKKNGPPPPPATRQYDWPMTG